MRHYITVFICLLLIPRLAHATIHITEVAWMGTSSSQFSEWIELYNDESTSVNLAGWKLYEGDGGTLVFTFTKTIPGNGYLLLERTTASAPDAVPGIDDESGSFGGGGLANTGEDLVLKDASGALVEALDYLSGWPAGDAPTKKTMQWNGSKWITATATPKVSTEGEGGTEESEEESDDEGEENGDIDPNPIPKISPNTPHIEFTVPTTVYKGVPYEYGAQPVLEYGYKIAQGNMYWNFGDGTALTQFDSATITHTYEYAGTYTLSFRFTDPTNRHLPITGTKKIIVTTPSITLGIIDGRALELKNTTTSEVDLSGWKVTSLGRSLAIPELTILPPKATSLIPFKALGLTTTSDVILIDPSGSVVASTAKKVASVSVQSLTTSVYQEEPTIESQNLIAQPSMEADSTPIRNRTKTIVFSAVALFVIGLSILLERLMGRREYLGEL